MSFSTASLRAKLLSAILVAALLPLVLATTLAVSRTRSAVREQVGAARAEMATQLAGWLERVMLERALELRGAAASGEIAAAALGFGDSTTTKNALAALLSRSGLLRSARLYNVQGAVVAWSGTPPAAAAAGSEGVAAIIAQKTTQVAAVSRDPAGRVVVRLAHPVTTSAGAAGVLMADVDWEGLMTTALGSLEQRAARGGTAAVRAYVVDASGTVIGSTKPDEIMTAKVGAASLIERLHTDSAGTQVVDLFGGPPSLVGFAPLRGRDTGKERFEVVGDADAHVVIAEPTSAAFAAAMALQWVLIAVSVGVGVLAAFVANWTAVRFTKPISDATASAERLAVGDTEHQIVPLQSSDELGRLNASLRGLHEYLRELTAAAHRVAAGDLAIVVTPKSERDDLSRAFATVVSVNVQVVSELADMTRRAAEGELTARVDSSRYKGGYRAIADGINGTLDAVTAPINEAAAVLEQLAERDLTARVAGEYHGDHARIKHAVNRAAENLDEAMARVLESSHHVASASAHIGSGGESLAARAADQATALREVSSSLQGLSRASRDTATNAHEVRRLADEARQSAEGGSESMARLSSAIDGIKSSSDATARIVKTIDEIAFQTNLLALNAAVEAARAGDAGRGFAVVADEVRSLAIRSAEAAKNTADLIEQAVQSAERGVRINAEVTGQLGEINARVGKVGEVMREIVQSASEQSESVTHISGALESMNASTNEVAANSEESASAAIQLSGHARNLQQMVAEFRLSGAKKVALGGRAGQAPSRSARARGGRAAPVEQDEDDVLSTL